MWHKCICVWLHIFVLCLNWLVGVFALCHCLHFCVDSSSIFCLVFKRSVLLTYCKNGTSMFQFSLYMKMECMLLSYVFAWVENIFWSASRKTLTYRWNFTRMFWKLLFTCCWTLVWCSELNFSYKWIAPSYMLPLCWMNICQGMLF